MKDEYKTIIENMRERHADLIAEADENTDKWYELFISEGSAGTRTVEQACTFEEIAQHIEIYGKKCGLDNINVDIWENRDLPRNLSTLLDLTMRPTIETELLIDETAYIIYLKNGHKVFNAVYHHCAISGKHYFSKGDDVYPIEDVYSHGMKPYVAPNEPPQTFIVEMFTHQVRVTIDEVYPHCKLSSVPECLFDKIHLGATDFVHQDNFQLEETCEEVDGELRNFKGSWEIIDLNYKTLMRLAMWVSNYGPDEGLTKELFHQTYGSRMGDHYLEKWDKVYKHNIIAMTAYFGNNSKEGQKFCDMMMVQMTKYEQRTKPTT